MPDTNYVLEASYSQFLKSQNIVYFCEDGDTAGSSFA